MDIQDKAQAQRQAMESLQARFGEKPKEQRQVKKTLDKDDFMKIMISEMRHQDPTKPMDAEKMSTQMAQVTSVEQMQNIGKAVERLSEKHQTSDRLAMSGLIGKQVTVDKGRFQHIKGDFSPINFDLPEDASKLKLKVIDDAGEVVFSKEIEPRKAGPQVFNWDGLQENGTYSRSGTYAVRVEAENIKGSAIPIDPMSKETIVGVSFEGGGTHFLVGDQKNPQKVNFSSVMKIDQGVSPDRALPKISPESGDNKL